MAGSEGKYYQIEEANNKLIKKNKGKKIWEEENNKLILKYMIFLFQQETIN